MEPSANAVGSGAAARPSLRIVWSWRARAIASGLALASAAVSVWAAIDPRSAVWVVVGGGLLAATGAFLALETYYYRVDGDATGLRRRSLRGTDALAWSEVRGVRLVATRQAATAIVHTVMNDLDAAFHVRLITEPRAGRTWDFNAWMAGYDQLRGLVAERGWPPVSEPPVKHSRAAARTLAVLEAVNGIGSQIVIGFALFFVTFIGSVSILAGADIEPTGNFLSDLALAAAALLGCAWLVDALIKRFGGRGRLQEGLDSGERRTLWMLHAAGLIGGVLALLAFVPRALAGGEHVWVEWVLVGFGVFMLVGALTD